MRKDIQTTRIEFATSSMDVADEKQFFRKQADNNNEPEDQTLRRK